jgi:hypothetical protein
LRINANKNNYINKNLLLTHPKTSATARVSLEPKLPGIVLEVTAVIIPV